MRVKRTKKAPRANKTGAIDPIEKGGRRCRPARVLRGSRARARSSSVMIFVVVAAALLNAREDVPRADVGLRARVACDDDGRKRHATLRVEATKTVVAKSPATVRPEPRG